MSRFSPVGKYKESDLSVLTPIGGGLKFVLSVANMKGDTSGDFYSLYAKRWPSAKEKARHWYVTKDGKYKLGAVETTAAQSDVWVVHLLVEDELGEVNEKHLRVALGEVVKMALFEKASVHVSNLLLYLVPGFQPLLKECLLDKGVSVVVYKKDLVEVGEVSGPND